MPLFSRTRQLAKRSKWLLIAFMIANNAKVRLRSSLGRIDSVVGATNQHCRIEETLEYIDRVYEDYRQYGSLSDDAIRDKRVVELGPGDNVGVALKFAAAGAAQVTCIDRFDTVRDRDRERRIYLAVRERLTQEDRRRFDDAVDLSDGIRFHEKRLRCVFGVGAEEADRALGPASADLIVSRAVIEEIYSIGPFFESMNRLLAPGGRMAHKIDLRDYGMFSGNGFHPLEFLTIPGPVYALMSKDSARPNRRPVEYYRRKMTGLGYEARIYATSVVTSEYSRIPREIIPHKLKLELGVDYDQGTVSLIRSIRPRLAPAFRNLSDEDLMTGGIFLAAQKVLS